MARVKKKRQGRPAAKVSAEIQRVYNAHAAVLEDINSKIDLVVEGYQELRRRLDHIETVVNGLEKDMDVVKTELRLIRHDLQSKINREEFELLEERVARLEKELSVR